MKKRKETFMWWDVYCFFEKKWQRFLNIVYSISYNCHIYKLYFLFNIWNLLNNEIPLNI